MRALLFSFLLNNIPLSSLSVLSTLLSFLFIFPPLGSPRLPPARIRSILLTLCHSPPTSHPLSSSPVGARRLFRIRQPSPGGFGAVGEAGGQILISYLRINHEVLSAQSRSDPSASCSASAGSLLPPPLPPDKWQPVHLTQTYCRDVTTALRLFHIQPLYNTTESI